MQRETLLPELDSIDVAEEEEEEGLEKRASVGFDKRGPIKASSRLNDSEDEAINKAYSAFEKNTRPRSSKASASFLEAKDRNRTTALIRSLNGQNIREILQTAGREIGDDSNLMEQRERERERRRRRQSDDDDDFDGSNTIPTTTTTTPTTTLRGNTNSPRTGRSPRQTARTQNNNQNENHAAAFGAAVGLREMNMASLRLRRMMAFESHDYDPIDCDIEEEQLRSRKRVEYQNEEWWKWTLSAIIGVVMGFVAFVVDGLVDKLNSFRFGQAMNLVIEDETSKFWAYLSSMFVTCCLAAVAGGLVSYVEPLAAGSGIPEMKTYLNGVHLKGLLRLKTLLAKLGGVAFSIGAGLIAGKEGPFVHGGGLVGGGLCSFGSHSLGFKTRRPNHFRNDRDKRDFVAIGTATGVAVAFGAPIGGMLFTVEEGTSFYNSSMLWRGFLATCVGVLTSHWLEQLDFDATDFARAKFGTHRDFGLYTDDEANYSKQYWWYFWEVPIFALIGCLGGYVGALFVNLNVRITAWRAKHIPVHDRFRRFLEVIAMAALTFTVMFTFMVSSPCLEIPVPLRDGHTNLANELDRFEYGEASKEEIRTDFFSKMYCPEGYYSSYGQLFFVPLSQSLKFLLHLGEVGENGQSHEFLFRFDALVFYFLAMFSLMTITYGIGAPTGLFVPSLSVGAAMGQICGRIVNTMSGWILTDVQIDLHAYAVIGAAASLGGATRMTISITVLVMETTGSMQLIIPLMLTIFCAKAVGDKFSHGIYDTHIKIRGAPFLEEPELAGPTGDKLRVNEIMARTMITIKPRMRVRDLIGILASNDHGAFPVTENPPKNPGDPFELHGTITRNRLLKMITHRIGFFDGSPDARPMDVYGYTTAKDRDDLLDKLKQIPFKSPHVAEVAASLSSVEMDSAWIDVSRLMQRHPFITHADARVSRAYRIFRTMGLRHLYVTPDKPLVVGVITRKDVIQENTSLTLGEKAQTMIAERFAAARASGTSAAATTNATDASEEFPGGQNIYSQDYADRFNRNPVAKANATTNAIRDDAFVESDTWNTQFEDDMRDDDDRAQEEEEEEEEEERLPYIPYYQGNTNDDDDDGNNADAGIATTANGTASSSRVAATANITAAQIVRRPLNGPENL
jgi:chloride channel 7